MRYVHTFLVSLLLGAGCAGAAPITAARDVAPAPTRPAAPRARWPEVEKFVRVATRKIVLAHVEVIDGTGAPPRADQNVYVEDGKITAIKPGADEAAAPDVTVLDLRGHAVMPGIIGMHEHLFYLAFPNLKPDGAFDPPALFVQMTFSAPRMYLANGVTTIRTAGSVSPSTDLKLRRAIDEGVIPGPSIDVTGPYLDGPSTPNLQIPELTGPEDARQTVAFWAERGVTSFKAYAHITRAELGAAIEEAHKHGVKVTGHLCSVTYTEAAELGIDDLEHGFLADTALAPDKKPDVCPDGGDDYTVEHRSPDSAEAKRLIATLVQRKVAVTSTLPNRASSREGAREITPAAMDTLSPAVRDAYLAGRARVRPGREKTAEQLRRGMALERAFVAAGGLLLAGADPVGLGGNVPGFGDHREIELLVEAGFTPVEAIRIATYNGALYLGRADRKGVVAPGKDADLVVVKGDPAARITDIENVEIVFKDGVGYDPRKLLAAVKGRYGEL